MVPKGDLDNLHEIIFKSITLRNKIAKLELDIQNMIDDDNFDINNSEIIKKLEKHLYAIQSNDVQYLKNTLKRAKEMNDKT